MTNGKITVNKYSLIALALLMLGVGLFVGNTFTKANFERKELEEVSKSYENLICQTRVQKGKVGDIESEYFIYEQSAKEEDCLEYIEYKNLPDDTETLWMNL